MTLIDIVLFRGGYFMREPWKLGQFGRFLVRQTPRVLICMPFCTEEPELVYRSIVRPIIKQVFGASCCRLIHPIEDDWQKTLRSELLQRHLIVFDHSHSNENVEREWRFWRRLVGTMRTPEPYRERADVCIIHPGSSPVVTQDDPRGSEFSGTLLSYTDDEGAVRFADEFHAQVEAGLRAIGFRRGFLSRWVCYPRIPPKDDPNIRPVRSNQHALEILAEWSEEGTFDTRSESVLPEHEQSPERVKSDQRALAILQKWEKAEGRRQT